MKRFSGYFMTLSGLLTFFLFQKQNIVSCVLFLIKKFKLLKTLKEETYKTNAFCQLVGNTPLVRLKRLSDDLGIDVYGKAEFLNPGGSVKDRVASAIIQDAERRQLLQSPGDTVYEGTSGSTGISLALVAKSKGYECCIHLPDDQAAEKKSILKVLGAKVIECPPCSIIDPHHYCNASHTEASKSAQPERRFFADQFENLANFQIHYDTTGEEIWNQMGHHIDGFVGSSGTGGTLAGVGVKLHEYNPDIKIVLADPQGSALYNKIRFNVLYNEKDAEGFRTRRIFDTIVEGVGINRLTKNFLKGYNVITHAYRISDLEVVHMSRYLLRYEGLFLGSSSALNCCGIVKAVAEGIFKKNSRVVLTLCDSGVRHISRFYNQHYLASHNLLPNYLCENGDENFFRAPKISSSLPSVRAALSHSFPKSVFDFVDPPTTV